METADTAGHAPGRPPDAAGDPAKILASGVHRYFGGAGADLFVFRPPEGNSRSTYADFDVAEDRLRIEGWLIDGTFGLHHISRSVDDSLRIETNEGEIWRVTYAGMVREHRQEWQARVFLQQALQMTARELRRPEP